MKVEVHHIQPVAAGGDDSADNAVVLCFDCHTDAGHYNPRHPRGSKVSPSELRLARDQWHEIVAARGILTPSQADFLYCRYLICKHFSILREACSGDLSEFPVSSPHLVRTDAHQFLCDILQLFPTTDRRGQVFGDTWATEGEYFEEHPELMAASMERRYHFPYFLAQRTPSRAEAEERISVADPISACLLRESVPVDEIATALLYFEQCGEDRYQEIYQLRPLWGVYLAVTNVSGDSLQLKELVARAAANGETEFRDYVAEASSPEFSIPLPAASIRPDDTVVLLVATILGPFEPFSQQTTFEERKQLERGLMQTVAHIELEPSATSHLRLWGPTLWPVRMELATRHGHAKQEIHDWDLQNVYVVDRGWEIGSCPQAFVERDDGTVVYVGELLAQSIQGIQTDHLSIPRSAVRLIVAELEDETTTLESIAVDGRTVARDVTLERGETFSLNVEDGSKVVVRGSYALSSGANAGMRDPVRRNEEVVRFRRQVMVTEGLS